MNELNAKRTVRDYMVGNVVTLKPDLELQQAMVVEKAHEKLQRHIVNGHRLGRPDGGSHRHQVVVLEFPAIAMLPQVAAHRLAFLFERQRGHRLAVEAQDIADHAIEPRAQDVATLCE